MSSEGPEILANCCFFKLFKVLSDRPGLKMYKPLGVVMHAFNPSIQVPEVSTFQDNQIHTVSSRTARAK